MLHNIGANVYVVSEELGHMQDMVWNKKITAFMFSFDITFIYLYINNTSHQMQSICT